MRPCNLAIACFAALVAVLAAVKGDAIVFGANAFLCTINVYFGTNRR